MQFIEMDFQMNCQDKSTRYDKINIISKIITLEGFNFNVNYRYKLII